MSLGFGCCIASRLTIVDIATDGEGIGEKARKETDLTEDEIKAFMSLKIKPAVVSQL